MNAEKPACMREAKKFDANYWDGNRKFGYGGYRYDERYEAVADAMIRHYELLSPDSILDIGCGKGALLKEFSKCFARTKLVGLDISDYAISHSFIPNLSKGNCIELPYGDWKFDFVYSINVFHNLNYRDLKESIKEMVRVGKEKFYICVESYRNEEELCNLQCWALTCLSFYSPDDWKQIFEDCGYKGDYEFIFFE